MQVFMMMPEDDFVEELQIGEEKKGGNKLLFIILLLQTVLVMVAVGYFIFFYDKDEGKSQAAPKEGVAETAETTKTGGKKVTQLGTGEIFEMEQFIVNLDEPGQAKYLKVSIAVELDSPEASLELGEKKLVARDQILVFLSSLNMNSTIGIEGKNSIKEGIINRLNNILVNGNVVAVYFKDFVVQ